MSKAGRPPKLGGALSSKERMAIFRNNKKNKELDLYKNIKTEYDIECFALEKANETYSNIKKQLFQQVEICNSDLTSSAP